jgi:segregation and condensation protein B
MKINDLEKKIINIIFASGDGIETANLIKILNNKSEESLETNALLDINKENIETSILNIKESLGALGLELIISKNHTGNFLSITTRPEYYGVLNSYFKVQIEEDLTPAQLQTLTIVAYMQEVSVQEVSFIRGVQSVQTLRALSTRGLVKKIGENYVLTLDAFKILGISHNCELKDFDKISPNIRAKLAEALNG